MSDKLKTALITAGILVANKLNYYHCRCHYYCYYLGVVYSFVSIMNWVMNAGKEIPVRKDLPQVFNKNQACAIYSQDPSLLEQFKVDKDIFRQ